MRVLLVVAMACHSAIATASVFELRGTVLDESGLSLPGARLTLVNEESGLVRHAVTGDSGYYQLPPVPPGEYTLEAELEGFATSRFAGLRYFADTKPIFNVTLRLREVQESMTFTGEAPLVNVSQSQIGHSVEQRELRELPLERRDYLELVTIEGTAHKLDETAPGGRVITGTPRQTLSGANAYYTSYQLDGFGNTRDQHGVAHVDVDIDAVEEFRVLSGQLSSEYGRSLAGIVSATTSSGADDFHGTLFGFLRPGAWDATDPLTGATRGLDRQEVGLTLSGPLVSERVHFFTSLSYRNQNEDVVVTAPFDDGRYQGVFDLPSRRVRFLAKVSARTGERHHWSVKTALSDLDDVEGVGGFDIMENAASIRNEDASVFGNLVSELGSVTSDLRVGLSSERFEAAAGPPPLGAVHIHPTLGHIGNTTALESVAEDHFELSETLSAGFGNHGVKAGVSVLRVGSTSRLTRYDDGVFFYAPGQASEPTLEWKSFPSEQAFELDRAETHVQLFVRDDWQLSPYLTLNLGLRWERESSVPDNDNFAPRLGLHWDLSRDGRTSVRAGYGVFHSFVFSIVDSLETLYGPMGRTVAARAPGDDAPIFRQPRNVYLNATESSTHARRSPFSQHFTVGIERALWAATSVAVDVTHIRGSDRIVPRDMNAPAFFDYSGGDTRTGAEADTTRPLGPDAEHRDLYLLASAGSSRYWGVNVKLTRRYATDFTVHAVYNWSRTTNDGDDFRLAESLPLDPSRPEREWGRSGTDIPHALILNGIWDAPYDVRFAFIFRLRSGRPVDPRVDVDLDGDRKLRERAFAAGAIFERNSFRAPRTSTLDLSLSRVWELGEGSRITGALDVFNVTNRLNPLQYLSSFGPMEAPAASFLEVVQAARPRQFQLSVRFAF